MDVKSDWLSNPWIVWPAALVIGILSSLISNWIWAKLRYRGKKYTNTSYSNIELRFESQYKTYNSAISSKNILKDIFKYKPRNNTKTNLIKLDKFFKYWLDDSSRKN